MVYDFERIPRELRECPQWVCWAYVERDGKQTKVPLNPRNLQFASVSDATTWGTFDEVRNSYDAARLRPASVDSVSVAGIGFVFSDYDSFAGIDVDSKDATADELTAQGKLISRFNSYTEISPSGSGAHIIVRGRIGKGRRKHGVEAYSTGRFFTFTGNVYGEPKGVEDRQALLTELGKELGSDRAANVFLPQCPQIDDDATIMQRMLGAANGDKVRALARGDGSVINSTDRSGSAIDMAFVNCVQFYTKNADQIERLWKSTPHAHTRPHKMGRADYVLGTISRSFDRMIEPVDVSAALESAGAGRLTTAANAALGNENGGALHPAPAKRKVKRYAVPVNPYVLPPGLVGELANFIYSQAPRPVAEIAMAGAIGWMAGVVGKAYNVNGVGLNMYLAMLASSGTGKEAISQAYGKIQAALEQGGLDEFGKFMGPGNFASPKALINTINEKPSCVSIITEFGDWLGQMLNERDRNKNAIKAQLLSIYTKSGKDAVFYEVKYADSGNDTARVNAPSLSLLGESTPSTFYRHITQQVVEDGFLPRFVIIEYEGAAPHVNTNAHKVPIPGELLARLGELVTQCIKLNGPVPRPVGSTKMSDLVQPLVGPLHVPFADECSDDIWTFSNYCTDEANNTQNEGIKNLWSRVWINVVKLAGIVAVGIDYNRPVIDRAAFDWARNIVLHSLHCILEKMQSGLIGHSEEAQQWATLLRCLKVVPTLSPKLLRTYGLNEIMQKDGVINLTWMQLRPGMLATFQNSQKVPTSVALDRAINRAVREELLEPIEKQKGAVLKNNAYKGQCWRVNWHYLANVAIEE